jgi:hypothetical protein
MKSFYLEFPRLSLTQPTEERENVSWMVCCCPEQVALILSIRMSFSERISRQVRSSMNRCIDRIHILSSDRLRPVEWLFPIPCLCLGMIKAQKSRTNWYVSSIVCDEIRQVILDDTEDSDKADIDCRTDIALDVFSVKWEKLPHGCLSSVMYKQNIPRLAIPLSDRKVWVELTFFQSATYSFAYSPSCCTRSCSSRAYETCNTNPYDSLGYSTSRELDGYCPCRITAKTCFHSILFWNIPLFHLRSPLF